jgi:hypothetical protein
MTFAAWEECREMRLGWLAWTAQLSEVWLRLISEGREAVRLIIKLNTCTTE